LTEFSHSRLDQPCLHRYYTRGLLRLAHSLHDYTRTRTIKQ